MLSAPEWRNESQVCELEPLEPLEQLERSAAAEQPEGTKGK